MISMIHGRVIVPGGCIDDRERGFGLAHMVMSGMILCQSRHRQRYRAKQHGQNVTSHGIRIS
jgi:hypothetical protein